MPSTGWFRQLLGDGRMRGVPQGTCTLPLLERLLAPHLVPVSTTAGAAMNDCRRRPSVERACYLPLVEWASIGIGRCISSRSGPSRGGCSRVSSQFSRAGRWTRPGQRFHPRSGPRPCPGASAQRCRWVLCSISRITVRFGKASSPFVPGGQRPSRRFRRRRPMRRTESSPWSPPCSRAFNRWRGAAFRRASGCARGRRASCGSRSGRRVRRRIRRPPSRRRGSAAPQRP